MDPSKARLDQAENPEDDQAHGHQDSDRRVHGIERFLQAAGLGGAMVKRGKGQQPTRLVIFRRPIEHRSTSRDELEAMVHTVVVEQLAELLNLTPGQVDERYGD